MEKFLTIIFIFIMAMIISCFINDAHVYDKVIIYTPNGTAFEVENVRIKDKTKNWKITCEDGSVYIAAKENCLIFD